MDKAERRAVVFFLIVVLIGLGLAYLGSQGSMMMGRVPLFALAIGLIFLIQWVAFIPAFIMQTEKFYDLIGSSTFILITGASVMLSPVVDGRSILLLILVIIWAGRLGTFLFRRVHKVGKDGRFDEYKPSFIRFLVVWTIQGAWVSFTLSAALIAITTTTRKELGVFALIGFIIWLIGFSIEVIADAQKSKFRANPENKEKFIQTGLWSRSRHPNYFGEIVLWIGIAIIAIPVLQGTQWVGVISPVFVAVLLTRVSGIPILEKRADEKWGERQEYQTYKAETPKLIPRL